MNIIKILGYAFLNMFDCMSTKMFRKLCERYIQNCDFSVETVLSGYIAQNQLVNMLSYVAGLDIKIEEYRYLRNSKLEVIILLNNRKLWQLFVDSIENRKLSVPEQFILTEKMPVEFFCQMYKHQKTQLDWFSAQIGTGLLQTGKTNYEKLKWYVQTCKLSFDVLWLFMNLFVKEANKCGNDRKQEPERGYCKLMQLWLEVVGAPMESFQTHEKMLDYVLSTLEKMQCVCETQSLASKQLDVNYI